MNKPPPVMRNLWQALITVDACTEKYAKAQPAERKQIQGFIKACTEPKLLVKGKWITNQPAQGVAYWLTWVKHLNTGRVLLTAGMGGPESGSRGLTANQMRKVVGLSPVKGGDYKIAVKQRGSDSLGEVKKGKIRLPSRSAGTIKKGAKK